jgi:hypothetical protein
MSLRDKFGTLPKFKMIGPDKATMCCPGPLHERGDQNPSLRVRVTPAGVILLLCGAGCSNAEILQAIGLDFTDLYPTPAHFHLPKMRHAFSAADGLTVLAFESLVVLQYANQLARGEPFTEADYRRLLRAATRIQRVMEATQ